MELDDDLQELDINNDVQNQRRGQQRNAQHEHETYNPRRREHYRQQQQQQREHDANDRRRRERRSQGNINSFLAACRCNIDTFDPDTANIAANDLGPMNVKCGYCQALGFEVEFKWNKEDPPMKHMGKMCCNQGKIILEPPAAVPIALYKLYTSNDPRAETFRGLLRYFNAGLAMGSIQVDDQTVYQGPPGAFKVHGQIYKRIGPMLPSLPSVYGDGTPKCLQIWFCDADKQADLRVRQDCGVRRNRTTYRRHKEIFQLLQDILRSCGNPLLHRFLTIYEEIERSGTDPDKAVTQVDSMRRTLLKYLLCYQIKQMKI